MNNINNKTSKGETAEEILRNYFLSIGYFVVRGSKFKFNQYDVTDVDLWLYGKNSPISRERLNVDIKNRRTPQALERIFWAKGLQSILGLNGCIVVTNDSRTDVRKFGLEHQIKVIDGRFYDRLKKDERINLKRISEEQLLNEIDQGSMGKLGGDWRKRYEASKSRLLRSLTFDGANAWLEDIRYFLTEIQSSKSFNGPALRLAYIMSAYFLISLDFILIDHVTTEQDQRRIILENGFRYGSAGKSFAEKVGKMAADLAGTYGAHLGIIENIKHSLTDQASFVKAELLAEYFSKPTIQNILFDTAREFEDSAFSLEIKVPSSTTKNIQALLGVFSDFFGLDRKIILI